MLPEEYAFFYHDPNHKGAYTPHYLAHHYKLVKTNHIKDNHCSRLLSDLESLDEVNIKKVRVLVLNHTGW